MVWQLAILAATAVVAFLAWRRPAARFVVRLDANRPRVVRGTVTPAFLTVVADLAAIHQPRRGTITGIATRHGIRLTFSRHLNANFRQQLRNWWGLHGW